MNDDEPKTVFLHPFLFFLLCSDKIKTLSQQDSGQIKFPKSSLPYAFAFLQTAPCPYFAFAVLPAHVAYSCCGLPD